ncbi:MAG TPA: hypothetical protein VN843_03665 [Anaerolineales bacterium]|nr:hypothetical protein [Anaerolineales bacterium]
MPSKLLKSGRALDFDRQPNRLTLLRKIYRLLLNTGRTYAAFTDEQRKLVKLLSIRGEILDPMSGYGSVTRYCADNGVRSYCIEYNLPQFLWQLLFKPGLARVFIRACDSILRQRSRWPKSTAIAVSSDNWFPPTSESMLIRLFQQINLVLTNDVRSEKQLLLYSAALLLPFVGRLSCSVPADIVTNVKKGGICVYKGWEEDYETYLVALIHSIESAVKNVHEYQHTLRHGDARTIKLPGRRFSAFLTSPPYPNHRDFVSMFAPEHAFLDLIRIPGNVTSRKASVDIIGSNFVAGRPSVPPVTKAAKRFLKAIDSVPRNSTAIRHDKQYYFPYFEHYFTDLENAFSNIERSLHKNVEGFIVVVNNTHRNIVVPVSDTVIEIWRDLGYKATIYDSNEYFHVGTKNPRARGLRARHTEYVIRVSR